MQTDTRRRGDHFLGRCFLQPGDVVSNAATEQFDVLRQVPEMAGGACPHPGPDVGSVEPHVAGGGRDRPGNEPSERRLAGAGWSDDPEDFAGLQRERNPPQRHAIRAGRHEGHLLDRSSPRGRGSRMPGLAGGLALMCL